MDVILRTYYFDWSGRRGLHVLAEDSDIVDTSHPDLDSWLDNLDEPSCLIGEATFESFNLSARKNVIDRCAREGHVILSTPNRLTGRTRRRLGIDEKSDANDVFVLREIARSKVHLKRPWVYDDNDPIVLRRKQASASIRNLRNTGTRSPRARSAGFNFHSDKDALALAVIANLPRYEDLTDIQRAALGNGKEYSKVVVAAVAVAAQHASNQSEFDQIAGLFAHGYPSQIRADLHWWSWRLVNSRADRGQGLRITISQWRREIRWLFHQIRRIEGGRTDLPEAA